MKKLMFVFLLSACVSVAQVFTPEEIKTLGDALIYGDTNVFFRLADKCPPEDNLYWGLQFSKSALLYEHGQYDQAIALASLVKDAAPAFAIRSYQGIAAANAKKGDDSGSLAARHMVDKLSDGGTPLMRKSDYKGAIKFYSELLAANPACTNTIVFASLAYAQEVLGQTNDALATCEQWVKAMPECPAAFRQRGGVKWKLGDKAGARADFDKVKRLGGRVDAKKPDCTPPAR